jgi:hypothetical protein
MLVYTDPNPRTKEKKVNKNRHRKNASERMLKGKRGASISLPRIDSRPRVGMSSVRKEVPSLAIFYLLFVFPWLTWWCFDIVTFG